MHITKIVHFFLSSSPEITNVFVHVVNFAFKIAIFSCFFFIIYVDDHHYSIPLNEKCLTSAANAILESNCFVSESFICP